MVEGAYGITIGLSDTMNGEERSMRMHAEVAGGGIAGLAVATMLAKRGWTVRVHERNEAIREVGAGIFLRRNTLNVLQMLGVADEIQEQGMHLSRGKYRDGVTGDTIHDREGGDGAPMWISPRETVVQALERKARDAHVEIVTNSHVIGADPSGVLTTDKGDFPADLVVGADGVSSTVRESLELTRMTRRLPSVVTRYLIPTRAMAPEDHTTMWWSGSRRIGIAPCAEDLSYVYMVCPETDAIGRSIPVDVAAWSRSFPMLADRLPLLAGASPIQNNYRIVTCHAWHKGRVALVGDAAHGLPPLLGQGAGLALSNANALAASVGNASDLIPQDLKIWERRFRHFSDKTQYWSMHLDRVTNKWPSPLVTLRGLYLNFLDSRPMRRRISIADRFPITSQDQMGSSLRG